MGVIRVIVVDDSALMRRILTRLLESDGSIKVIDYAVNGEDGLKKICRQRPDVVTLDVEMPVMDGIETLRRIMAQCPLPVIMVSSHTTQGARVTMQALAAGAVDFVAKPARSFELEKMAAELVAKVKAAAGVQVNRLIHLTTGGKGVLSSQAGWRSFQLPLSEPAGGHLREEVAVTRPSEGRVEVVVIGSSTGGPAALQVLIPALPVTFPAPVIIVQHLPVGFSKSLAEHLDRRARLRVKHAEQGEPLQPGIVYVAPAGLDFTFRRSDKGVVVHLDAGVKPVPPGGFRPSVDVTMTSAAEVFAGRALGVLLTGMGRDGAKGMLAIRQAGGYTIAEHESTCVVYGMPRAAVEIGAAEKVLPLPEIAAEIIRLV